MPFLSLNPDGILAKLFGQDVRRPLPPVWDPRQRQDGGDDISGQMTPWMFYQEQIKIGRERTDAYKDYEEMDYDDLISSVLDAVAEDSCQQDFMSGQILWCQSKNKHIEKVVNDLYLRLKMEECAPQLVREIAKFGDDFEYLHQSRGEGIIAMEHYVPQRVWRFDDAGRLRGFTLDMPFTGEGQKLFLPWEFQHFMRTAGRRLPGSTYGDAWIRPARRLYRKLQMMEDSIVMYRLRRAPDRDVYYIDIGGAPIDEGINIVRMWRRALKKHHGVKSSSGELRSDMNPLAPDEDLFWPTKEGSNSRIERLSGAANVGDVWDFKLMIDRLFSTLRAPKEYFGFNEGGGFNADKSLAQIDIRWARGCKICQKGLTTGMTKTAMIHLALLGINPVDPQNEFETHMTPISFLDEQQRLELYTLRLQAIENMNRLFGDVKGINQTKWFTWLLHKFGGFGSEFLEKFVEAANSSDGASDEGFHGRDLTGTEQSLILEALKDIPSQIRNVLTCSTSSRDIYASDVRIPSPDYKPLDLVESEYEAEGIS